MNKIYFSSDLHLGHNREFIYKPRGFENIYDHDHAIIERFNEVMDWEDDLFILGDVMLNDNENGIKLLQQIPGNKYIIIGNHDTDTRIELYKNIWSVDVLGYATMFKYGGLHFYLSHYPTITSNLDENKSLKSRVLNLYGHTHQHTNFYDGRPCNYHVGVDSHNCYPVEINEIVSDIKAEVDACFKAAEDKPRQSGRVG